MDGQVRVLPFHASFGRINLFSDTGKMEGLAVLGRKPEPNSLNRNAHDSQHLLRLRNHTLSYHMIALHRHRHETTIALYLLFSEYN